MSGPAVPADVERLLALLRPGRLAALIALEREPLSARGLEATLAIKYPAARFLIKSLLADELIEQAGTERNRQNKEVPTYRTRHRGWRKLVPAAREILKTATR